MIQHLIAIYLLFQLKSHKSKCPLQESAAAAVSKSKKKRLRKKKKIEEEAAVKRIQEVEGTSAETLEIQLGTTLLNSQTQSDQKNTSLEKGHREAVDTVSPSDKNSTKIACAPHKCDIKPKEDSSHRNSIIINHFASESAAVVVPELPASGVKDKNCVQSEPAVQITNMDSKPTRDDVMAQREAKKLAKLGKKNKSGNSFVVSY